MQIVMEQQVITTVAITSLWKTPASIAREGVLKKEGSLRRESMQSRDSVRGGRGVACDERGSR